MSLQLAWNGVDGSVWDLQSGPVRGATGISGLGMIALDSFLRTSSVLDGQKRTGWRANPTAVQLPVKLGHYGLGGFPSFKALNRAWWQSLRPHKYGRLDVVDQDDASVRSLTCRLESDGRSFEFDPIDMGWDEGVLALVGDDPWWYGPTVSAAFGAVSLGNYYGGNGGSGYGPPFYVSSANSTGSQSVSNPGDVDAWPVWTLSGPLSAFDLAVGSQHLILPASAGLQLLGGQTLVIDTNPAGGQTVLVYNADGTLQGNYTRLLSSFGFAAIPAGNSATVSATLTGTGQANMALRPRFFDAY